MNGLDLVAQRLATQPLFIRIIVTLVLVWATVESLRFLIWLVKQAYRVMEGDDDLPRY